MVFNPKPKGNPLTPFVPSIFNIKRPVVLKVIEEVRFLFPTIDTIDTNARERFMNKKFIYLKNSQVVLKS